MVLPAWVPPLTTMLRPARTHASRNAAAALVERAERDEVVERVRLGDELADVDGGEAARDAVEHDVQAVTAGQHRVDERLAEVEPPAAGRQHPLDQLAHLLGGQHHRRELVAAVARDEDPLGLVDPDLLDLRVVEEPLQRTEAHQVGHELPDDPIRLVERAHRTGEAALLVLGDRIGGGAAHRVDVGARIDPSLADQRAHAIAQYLHPLPPESRSHPNVGPILPNSQLRVQGAIAKLWTKGRTSLEAPARDAGATSGAAASPAGPRRTARHPRRTR